MRTAILSRNPQIYSTRRLVEAGRQRGHEVETLDVLRRYKVVAAMKRQGKIEFIEKNAKLGKTRTRGKG